MYRWILLLAVLAARAHAHRLDEYLQAALISVERDGVTVELNLTPGVAVLGKVLDFVDTDRDGVVSAAEQQGYAHRVMGDISLAVDNRSQPLSISTIQFPPVEQMREGIGTIRMVFRTNFDAAAPGVHELRFENRHHSEIGVFLANALLPVEPISIVRQTRYDRQAFIRINYAVGFPQSRRTVSAQALLAAILITAVLSVLFFKLRKQRRVTVTVSTDASAAEFTVTSNAIVHNLVERRR